jgi:ribosomal protein S12
LWSRREAGHNAGMSTVSERRREPRVLAQNPLEVSARVPSNAIRRVLFGRLVNASRGGIAFISEDDVEIGELFEVAISGLDGRTCLQSVHVQVVAKHAEEGDHVAHCAFVSPVGSDDWLAALQRRP